MVLYTICWTSLFYITGAYRSIYYRSRINELYQTLLTVVFGTLILLFSFILKNPHENNKSYYFEFFSILIPVFSLSLLHRFLFLNFAKKQIKKGSVFFPTLLIGRTEDIISFYREFTSNTENNTHKVIGYIDVDDYTSNSSGIHQDSFTLPKHAAENIQQTVDQNKIEEIIIVPSRKDRYLLTKILQQIGHLDVNIKIAPDAADILSGNIHTENVMATPLIEAHTGNLPLWQQNIKRLFDFAVALIFGILFIPFFIYFAIRVRLSSKGPIIFKQERIGLKEKPCVMYKFRSMIDNAEMDGPQLSSASDPRITRWGKMMRKWRLDETPQIWNVLKGEMSLVGPRPERKFFVDQLIRSNPEYRYIFKSKPGITSWGMVKFGYASNVDEMVQRMPYDLMYVENASLLLDIKILIFTIKLIFSGKGK
jgi:exopolysaccharide biosynthesis polyprenyl glycosylphosphotransferase